MNCLNRKLAFGMAVLLTLSSFICCGKKKSDDDTAARNPTLQLKFKKK